MPKSFIGTSGFQYSHWNYGIFYPKDCKDKLEFYAGTFNALEVNASFYSIPKPETVKRWSDTIHDGSKLVLKAPKSVTHSRRMKLYSEGSIRDGVDLLRYFFEGYLQIDERKRGPVLVQVPEQVKFNADRLKAILGMAVAVGLRVAFEARHTNWLSEETLAILRDHGSALVSADWRECPVPVTDTTDFVYLRRHGPESDRTYAGLYSPEELAIDAELVLDKIRAGKDVYVFFNNDGHAHAVSNARDLKMMVETQLELERRSSIERGSGPVHLH